MQGINTSFMGLAVICLLSAAAHAGDIPGRGDALFQFSIDSGQGGFGASDSPAATNQAPGLNLRHPQTPTAMTLSVKCRFYLRSTYGPRSVGYSLAGAGINQGWNDVPEWGQGMEGYGKRFASSFGQKAIKRSIQVGAEIMLKEDPRYFASGRSGIWQRTRYAAGQTFISHRDAGGIRPAYSRFVGTVAGVCVSRQWYPDSDRKAEDYVSSSAISMVLDIARNVFNEFWPDVKRLLFH